MSIRWKVVALTVGIAILSAVIFDGYLVQTLWAELSDRTESDLGARAELAVERARAAPDLLAEAPALASGLARAAGARVTIVDPEGAVRGDSSVAPDQLEALEDHGRRPEVLEARRTGAGRDARVSSTVGVRMLYVARRLDRPDGAWVVRLAYAPVAIDQTLSGARRRVLEGTLLALTAALAVGLFGASSISRRLVYLTGVAKAMRGDLTRRARVSASDETAALGAALDELAEGLARSLEELAAERDRFGAVLESMREGVLVTDEAGDIALVNPALSDLLGVRGGALGRPPIEVLRSAGLHEVVAQVARSGAAATREIEIAAPAPPHGPRRLIVDAAPLATPARARAARGVVAVFFDVTEMRRLERRQRDFVANASHELRTPVTSIRGSSETLLAGALDDPAAAREFVEVIDRNAARLQRLASDLLDLSRIEAHERPLSPAPLDLAEQAGQAAALLRDRAGAKGTRLEVGIAPGTRARADARALEQVLTNLLENAIVHTPPGSRVAVRARAQGGRVILEVEDDGPGIPPPHQDRVFERFYRVDPGRSRDAGGTGLGLSITKHLVEAMQGRIEVGSGAMGGALIRVTLPEG